MWYMVDILLLLAILWYLLSSWQIRFHSLQSFLSIDCWYHSNFMLTTLQLRGQKPLCFMFPLSITSTFCAEGLQIFYLSLGYRNVAYVYLFPHQSSLEHSESFQSTDPGFSSVYLNFLLVYKYCLSCVCWFLLFLEKLYIPMPGLLVPPPKCLSFLSSLYLFAVALYSLLCLIH